MSDSDRMPEIAFHLNVPDRLDYACRYVRKALRHDTHVTIVAPMEMLRVLSSRLWKFAGHEFLAHAVYGDDEELFALAPISLVEQPSQSAHRGVLLQLGDALPQGYESFERVVEVVSSFDAQDKALARQRWRQYQQAGCQLETFDFALREGETR